MTAECVRRVERDDCKTFVVLEGDADALIEYGIVTREVLESIGVAGTKSNLDEFGDLYRLARRAKGRFRMECHVTDGYREHEDFTVERRTRKIFRVDDYQRAIEVVDRYLRGQCHGPSAENSTCS